MLVSLLRPRQLSVGIPRRPATVAASAAALYVLFVLAELARGHSPIDFAWVSAHPHDLSPTLQRYAPVGTNRVGFDGQFGLFIALDPHHAAPAIDLPSYRYSHILYPMLARTVAIGSPTAIPTALIIVNVAAVVVAVWAVANLLVRSALSPRWAWLLALYPGMIVAVARDLNEPLAYALALCGLVALDWQKPRRLTASVALFAAAGLTRETMLVIPVAAAAAHAWNTRRYRIPFATVTGACAPYLAWRVILQSHFHTFGSSGQLARLPFEGLIAQRAPIVAAEWLTIGIPLILLIAALGLTIPRANRPVSPYAVILGAEILLSVFLGRYSYDNYPSASRLQMGVLMTAILAPLPTGLPQRLRTAAGVIAFLWLPTYIVAVAYTAKLP